MEGGVPFPFTLFNENQHETDNNENGNENVRGAKRKDNASQGLPLKNVLCNNMEAD